MPTQSLRALLTHLIDYAGLYPPAGLPIDAVAARYDSYLASPESWMLNRLVLPHAQLASARPGWRITLLVDAEPGPLPPSVEVFETRLATRLSLPTYCEVPLDAVPASAFAKIRTGGLTPQAVPSAEHLADFLADAAARRLPFKATAGLHHPLRAAMHGFLNVFLAAAFAWHGADRGLLLPLLSETDPHSFQFTDAAARWRGHEISTVDIAAARRDFAHSFGSCSFEEPVADLRQLGLLP